MFMKRFFFASFIILFHIEQCVALYDLKLPEGITSNQIVEVKNPMTFLWNLIAYAIGIAGVLAVIGVTWWGIQMILSSGEDEKMKKARYILIYSLIGVLVAGLAYGVVDVVSRFRF